MLICFAFAAKYGWPKLLRGWALLANPVLCQYIKLFFFLLGLKTIFKLAISFLQTICRLQMIDPGGIANWSVTHVDWSEGKWHPKAYRAQDVTFDLLKKIAVCNILSYPLIFILVFHTYKWPFVVNCSLLMKAFTLRVTKRYKLHCLHWQILHLMGNYLKQSFTTAEKSDNPALPVEWNETTLLFIWEKVLPWNSGQITVPFLQLHDSLVIVHHLPYNFWVDSPLAYALRSSSRIYIFSM